MRKADGAFFTVVKDGEAFKLLDVATGAEAGTAQKGEIDQIKPNAGVQALVTGALVQFQLSDADPGTACSRPRRPGTEGRCGTTRTPAGFD